MTTGSPRRARHRDVLDALHQPDEPVPPVGDARREANSAVAHHHGGDSVPAARCEVCIPGDVAVEVRVDVDEARSHGRAISVDRPACRSLHPSHFRDDPVGDGHVRRHGGCSSAVDDSSASDDQVVHVFLRARPLLPPPWLHRRDVRHKGCICNLMRDSGGVTTEENKAIVQRYWDALAARDWDRMKALLTEDAHYTDVGTPGPGGTGPDGVVGRAGSGSSPWRATSISPARTWSPRETS